MVKIDKRQKDYLLECGFVFGRDLHHTVGKGKKKTYYATESEKIIECLKKLEKE